MKSSYSSYLLLICFGSNSLAYANNFYITSGLGGLIPVYSSDKLITKTITGDAGSSIELGLGYKTNDNFGFELTISKDFTSNNKKLSIAPEELITGFNNEPSDKNINNYVFALGYKSMNNHVQITNIPTKIIEDSTIARTPLIDYKLLIKALYNISIRENLHLFLSCGLGISSVKTNFDLTQIENYDYENYPQHARDNYIKDDKDFKEYTTNYTRSLGIRPTIGLGLGLMYTIKDNLKLGIEYSITHATCQSEEYMNVIHSPSKTANQGTNSKKFTTRILSNETLTAAADQAYNIEQEKDRSRIDEQSMYIQKVKMNIFHNKIGIKLIYEL